MIRITFTAEDREALGVPEVIEYDNANPRLRDLKRLKAEVGLSWAELGKQLEDSDLLAMAALVWLAANTADGVSVTWESFDLDLINTSIELVDSPKASKK
ncbi:hypothetical protein [Micromonospora sp. CA-246542]|uniref:hypothetical protein n=1 Tax=Micromonospora sp. CA-246542 TaxID=3239959 RepID=UPI003D8D9449